MQELDILFLQFSVSLITQLNNTFKNINYDQNSSVSKVIRDKGLSRKWSKKM